MKRLPSVNLGYPTEAQGKIPSFRSVEEEATFWDTHDVVDYLDFTSAATITRSGDLGKRLTIRLDEADAEAVTRTARSMGVGPSTLIRIWIKERLGREAS